MLMQSASEQAKSCMKAKGDASHSMKKYTKGFQQREVPLRQDVPYQSNYNVFHSLEMKLLCFHWHLGLSDFK